MHQRFNKVAEEHADGVLKSLCSFLLNDPDPVGRTNAVQTMVFFAQTAPEVATQVIDTLEGFASHYKSEGRAVYANAAAGLIDLLPYYPQKVFPALKAVLLSGGTDDEVEILIIRKMKTYKIAFQPQENGLGI